MRTLFLALVAFIFTLGNTTHVNAQYTAMYIASSHDDGVTFDTVTKQFYIYNINNQMDSSWMEWKNVDFWELNNTYKYSYTTSGKLKSTIRYSSRSGGQPSKYQKYVNTYDANDLIIYDTTYVFTDNQWASDEYRVYDYNSGNMIDTIDISFYYNNPATPWLDWTLGRNTQQLYYKDGRLKSEDAYQIELDGTSASSRYIGVNYDANNRRSIDTIIHYPVELVFYHYNSHGDLDRQEYYAWDDFVYHDFIFVSKTSYEYPYSTGLEGENQKATLTLYPNPATDAAWVHSSEGYAGYDKLSVYDLTGKEIKSLRLADFRQQDPLLKIDLSDVSEGVYLVRLEGSKGVQTKKLVVNN